MSSDESVIISDAEADENALSDENLSPTQSRKKLVKHMQQWRSDEFQSYIDSLDRKVARRRTARAMSMVLPTETGSPSSREAPIDCPDWAKTLFD